MVRRLLAAGWAFTVLLFAASALWACPFCAPVSKTLSEEIAGTDVAIIAKLVRLPGIPTAATGQAGRSASLATFSIDELLRGTGGLKRAQQIRVAFPGDARLGDPFLLMGVDPPDFTWSSPLRLNDRQRKYLIGMLRLPKKGAKRLAYFQDFLEDSDAMLARDAYDEFARAPYSEVKQLKPFLRHDQLVSWIKDSQVPASRRRLYLTMLGVCGDRRDIPMLEEMLRGPRGRSGLDALIACYLTLRGPEGVPLIENLFLKAKKDNFADDYADVYAAIMALRFHGTENDVVPRKRVLQSLRFVLDKPQMADLVVSDLARWQDWSQVDRLVQLFKDSDPKKSWVRTPIVNYLLVCPLPEAKKAIAELETIDPESVRRAKTIFHALPRGK